MDRPTLSDWKLWLSDRIEASLGDKFGKLSISFLSQTNDVADGTTVLRVCDGAGKSRAVVLCAAPVAPDMVKRAMYKARQAKMSLGPCLGAPILEPLMEGGEHGLSFAVLPYCNSLSKFRPLWWMQRARLRTAVLEWLWRVTECTVCNVELPHVEGDFAAPLRKVASLKALSGRVRTAAEWAAGRLVSGEWRPKYVLMHADLWKGNILVRPGGGTGEKRLWVDQLAIIDWAGSEIHGYAIFDLIRISQSLQLNKTGLRTEVGRHCHLLQCEVADAMSYLLAALGHIAIHIEYFSVDTYARMADACFATLDETLRG